MTARTLLINLMSVDSPNRSLLGGNFMFPFSIPISERCAFNSAYVPSDHPPLNNEFDHAGMRLITVVPQKDAISTAKTETFFGILLAVFVGMRTVYEEKNRAAKLAEIHQRGVAEMLFDSGLHGGTLEFPAD